MDPLTNVCIKPSIKCLKLKMPNMPKIVERAFSTIDSNSNGQWCTFALIIKFVSKSLFVRYQNGIFLSPKKDYGSGDYI